MAKVVGISVMIASAISLLLFVLFEQLDFSGPHLIIISSKLSPGRKYIAREEQFGRDSGAFNIVIYKTLTDRNSPDARNAARIFDDYNVSKFEWVDNHTLRVCLYSLPPDDLDPKEWNGVKIIY